MGGRQRHRAPTRREPEVAKGCVGRRAKAATAGGLALAILVVGILVYTTHRPALSATALSYDDNEYLTDNALVRNPSWASARTFVSEVLTPSTVGGYYQPLAMISLMLDCAMGGSPDNLYPFHRTSLVLHIANTGLIVIFLYLVLGFLATPRAPKAGEADARWRGHIVRIGVAAAVGLLFGLHPLTVEPIPWVGERKTLLAAFFGMWCLIFYVRYARTRSWGMYAACLVAYVLALMSKPTSTPLPAVMLLLDFWPLGRLSWRSVLEKVPFFAVGGVSAVITFISQARTAVVVLPSGRSASAIPLILCHNIVFYLYKIVWPVKLSSHYPFPEPLALSNPMVLAGVIGTCILITALVLSLRRTRALATGWLIFFIALLPTMQVIGFSQVIASDKFAYLPSIGLLLILAWAAWRVWDPGGADGPGRGARAAVAGVVAVLCVSEAVATRYALRPWRDTVTLSHHIMELAPRAASPHFGLGTYLARQDRLAEACDEFRKALELDPHHLAACTNLGGVLVAMGKTDEAIGYLLEAQRLTPNDFTVLNNLAMCLAAQGKDDEAIVELTKALKIRPGAAQVQRNLADTLARRGRYAEAVEHYEAAIRLRPDEAETHCRLADTLAEMGKDVEAINQYGVALRLQPAYAEAHSNLATVLVAKNRLDEAVQHAAQALRINPEFAMADYNLALALAKQGKTDEALAKFREALRLAPGFAEAHNNLGALLLRQGRPEEAVKEFSEAARLKPDYLDAHYNLGYVLEGQGKMDEAIGEYHQALRINPRNAVVRKRLDEALEKQATLEPK